LLAMPTAEGIARQWVCLAPMGEAATGEALVIAKSLRGYGVAADVDGRGGSLKIILRRANTSGATYCIVLGDAELAQDSLQVKDLQAHTQENLSRTDVARILADRIRSSRQPGGA